MSARAFLAATLLPRLRGEVVTLGGRPCSPVVHLVVGKKTRSGRSVAADGRTVCRAKTRRLYVFERAEGVLDRRGRRVCARCIASLPDQQFRTRADWDAAYGHLTVLDLVNANHLVIGTDESHRVGYLAGLLLPPPPAKYTRRRLTAEEQELRRLHDRIEANRDWWRKRERTPEEVGAAAMQRELDIQRDAQILAAHRKGAAMDRALDRRNAGKYLTPWERDLASA